jgi:hypothetical protein
MHLCKIKFKNIAYENKIKQICSNSSCGIYPAGFSAALMNSQHTQSGTAQPFTDKVFPMAVGLKVRLTFGKGSTVKTAAYVPPIQTYKSTEEARRKAGLALSACENGKNRSDQMVINE